MQCCPCVCIRNFGSREGVLSASHSGRFTFAERAAGKHWTGGWVGPRTGLVHSNYSIPNGYWCISYMGIFSIKRHLLASRLVYFKCRADYITITEMIR